MTERAPAQVFSLAEYLCDEMQARGWTIETVGARMGGEPGLEALAFGFALCADNDLRIEDPIFDGIARAFGVGAEYLKRLHSVWLKWPDRRAPFEVPDKFFGPAMRAALKPPAK